MKEGIWEPLEHLVHAKKVVAKFEQKNKIKQAKDDEVEEYEVEKILMKREIRKKVSLKFSF